MLEKHKKHLNRLIEHKPNLKCHVIRLNLSAIWPRFSLGVT
jgi:hypothetical protein